MNLDELHRKLIQVARANPPSERVPYGFERRVMGALKNRAVLDHWAFWAHALWRAAAPCVGIVIVLAAWSLLTSPIPALTSGQPSVDVAQDLENTVFAAAEQQPPPDLFR